MQPLAGCKNDKKQHPFVLQVLREPTDQELLRLVTRPVAVVTWQPFSHSDLPVFAVDDVDGVAQFIMERWKG